MNRRWPAALAAVAVLTVLAPAAPAFAAPPAVAPASPSLSTPVTVSWRATATAGYAVTMTIVPTGSNTNLACSWGSSSPVRRVRRGALLQVKLRQAGEGAALTHKWCPGQARVTISRFPPDYKPATVIAKRSFRIRRAADETPPGLADTPATIRLLPGSTISIAAAGHPDRTAPVRGVLRGGIPSPFRLGDEIRITRAGGGFIADAIPADPRCPAVPSPTDFQVVLAEMRLPPTGPVRLGVTFGAPGVPPTSCGTSGVTGWSTTIILTGTIGPKGLLALPMTGAADGITLSLLVQVDLSGRPAPPGV